MDKIILENMQFYGYHGVLPEETKLGQHFTVSVVMGTDIVPAAQSDDLTLSLNYAVVYSTVQEIMEGTPVQLLETLAETIASRVLALGALTVRITVKKIHPPIAGHMDFAAVEIERRRSDG